jgi:PEP-CTERM motif
VRTIISVIFPLFLLRTLTLTPLKEMNSIRSPRIVAACSAFALSSTLHAQTLDWGDWDSSGNGVYENGDSIVISGLVNGSTSAVNNETNTPHVITDPAFPFDNAPGVGEYGYFHNAATTTSAWSVLIDVSGFSIGPDTVIGFSNLDGRSAINTALGYATVRFYDSAYNQVTISPASFIGNYDYNWQGVSWDANSTYDPVTGRWDVIRDSGATHPAGSYFAGVGDAFFLTNLPSNIASIVFTKNGPTNYFYDSTLFYAGNAVVPEPSGLALVGLSGALCLVRRRR